MKQFVEQNMYGYRIHAPQLGEVKTVRVWTPDHYRPEQPSAALFMHDAQNLFDLPDAFPAGWEADRAMPFSGVWQADRAADDYAEKHACQLIVVGVDQSLNRFNEYCPPMAVNQCYSAGLNSRWSDYIDSPRGDRYAGFFTDTLVPFVLSEFPGVAESGKLLIGGSSMGGLISLCILSRSPGLFMGTVCFSPALAALDVDARRELLDMVRVCPAFTRFYFYVGGFGFESEFVAPAADFVRGLALSGQYEMIFHQVPTKDHSEHSWAEELPSAL
ncbi:MAG TPA: alpha/beta hydrolase-fold protein, partial [Bacillota bacterium]|nr:alpha/beta hydrolase-fold protein [Bacillota bacterium]